MTPNNALHMSERIQNAIGYNQACEEFYARLKKRMKKGEVMEELNMENLPRKIWELKRTKRHVGWFHWGVLFVGIVLIVYSQSHDTVAIEVPVYDAALMQRYQVELDLTRKQRDDYRKQAELTKQMLLASNTKVAQYEQHLKALSESVPSQPVILEAVRKEASTPAGFRQVVARNFGKEIAARIQIIQE